MDQSKLEQIVQQQMPDHQVVARSVSDTWPSAQADAQSKSIDALQRRYAADSAPASGTTSDSATANTDDANVTPDTEALAREFLGSDAETAMQYYGVSGAGTTTADGIANRSSVGTSDEVGTVLVKLPEGASASGVNDTARSPAHKAVIVSGAEGRVIGMQG